MKIETVFKNYFCLPCKKYLTVEKCKEIPPPVVKLDSAKCNDSKES